MMPTWFYFARPSNMAFHDLTTIRKPPSNLRSLLGLGLKFIPTPRYSHSPSYLSEDKDSTLPQFERDLKLRCYFASGDNQPTDSSDNPDYNPRMYIKTKWNPPPWAVPPIVDDRHTAFARRIRSLFSRRSGRSNLIRHQRETLQWLRDQDDFVVISCDKNFGPAIMEKPKYCRLVLQHLSTTGVYNQITARHARHSVFPRIKTTVSDWIKKYTKTGDISKSENRFFRHGHSLVDPLKPLSVFYIMPKIHKTPMAVRPVVSYSGSYLYSLGVWCDDKLQPVAQKQRSFFKSSFVLLQRLAGIELPPGARLFTADADAMYTNIPTRPALHVINDYLKDNKSFSFLPRKAIFDALSIILRNNYFTFGDTYWHQVNGVAMGAPPSPSVATIFFAPHEDYCCDEHDDAIHFYVRFIDDVFGIWIPPLHLPNLSWQLFQAKMNNYHGLNWRFTDLSDTVEFMDLKLYIQDGTIYSSLYEKALNHHLYIPPHSSHPPGVTLGLVHGLVFRIVTLCSHDDDVLAKLRLSFQHLRRRGYAASKILPIYHDAIKRAKDYIGSNTDTKMDRSSILLKLHFHPQDPPSSELQRAWKEELSTPVGGLPLAQILSGHTKMAIGVDKLTVCYRRPPNLGNLLSNRQFAFKNGSQVSSFLED
jgi:hypothetical protein